MSVLERNNVKISGRGTRAIVFAHGYGCDQTMWRLVTPAFEDDFQVVLFDHVGCGKSDVSSYDRTKYASLDGYVADLLEICESLKLQDVVFVGHSVSAMIGVLAAIQEPERFSRLILVGPSPSYINDGDYIGGFTREDIEALLDSVDDNFLGWSSAMAPVIMGNPDRPDLGQELVNSFCQMRPDIAREFARVTFTSDNRDDLRKVRAKTLVLQCSDDVIAPAEVGRYVSRNIQNSRLVQMKATGHCPNLSAPEETVDAIWRFLKE